MIISVFVGWVLDRSVVRRELMADDGSVRPWMIRLVTICLRYIAPACIGLVFLFGLGLL